MSRSKIEWTDRRWNPVRGCSRVSEGCRNCYAERQAARFTLRAKHGPNSSIAFDEGPFHGFVRDGKWTGRVELVESKLREPLSWRKPSRVFVNSMSDLFHESLSFDAVDQVFAVMALAREHTFQVLTKRPQRMLEYLKGIEDDDKDTHRWERYGFELTGSPCADGAIEDAAWPLPNVWLGVSVEDQASADERIPLLLDTPAAVRFISAEPLLGSVDLERIRNPGGESTFGPVNVLRRWTDGSRSTGIDWVIVGGESGPGARPCDVQWIQSIVEQCRAAKTPVFVKQLGARSVCSTLQEVVTGLPYRLELKDRKGGDIEEWPASLRVREFPHG